MSAFQQEELRVSGTPGFNSTAALASAAPGGKRKVPNAKTALCTNFMKHGECTYGDSCTFAHGQSELVINKRQKI